jgi:hypothetical protein
LENNIDEGRKLIGSGIEGANTARKNALEQSQGLEFNVSGSWKLAVVGACVGAVAGYFSDNAHSKRNAAVGSLLGAALGVSGGFAWAGRHLATAMTEGAMKGMAEVRDEAWLNRHPVAYGD